MKVGIEGAIIGGVVGVVSVIVGVWWVKRKQKRKEGSAEGVRGVAYSAGRA